MHGRLLLSPEIGALQSSSCVYSLAGGEELEVAEADPETERSRASSYVYYITIPT